MSNASAKIIWTEEEDRILLDSVKERGNQWKVISLKIGNNKTGQNVSLEFLGSLRDLNKFVIFSAECVTISLREWGIVLKLVRQHRRLPSSTLHSLNLLKDSAHQHRTSQHCLQRPVATNLSLIKKANQLAPEQERDHGRKAREKRKTLHWITCIHRKLYNDLKALVHQI